MPLPPCFVCQKNDLESVEITAEWGSIRIDWVCKCGAEHSSRLPGRYDRPIADEANYWKSIIVHPGFAKRLCP